VTVFSAIRARHFAGADGGMKQEPEKARNRNVEKAKGTRVHPTFSSSGVLEFSFLEICQCLSPSARSSTAMRLRSSQANPRNAMTPAIGAESATEIATISPSTAT
jgi:hypothetical protein